MIYPPSISYCYGIQAIGMKTLVFLTRLVCRNCTTFLAENCFENETNYGQELPAPN